MKVRSFAKRALSIVASVAMLLSCTVFSGMFGTAVAAENEINDNQENFALVMRNSFGGVETFNKSGERNGTYETYSDNATLSDLPENSDYKRAAVDTANGVMRLYQASNHTGQYTTTNPIAAFRIFAGDSTSNYGDNSLFGSDSKPAVGKKLYTVVKYKVLNAPTDIKMAIVTKSIAWAKDSAINDAFNDTSVNRSNIITIPACTVDTEWQYARFYSEVKDKSNGIHFFCGGATTAIGGTEIIIDELTIYSVSEKNALTEITFDTRRGVTNKYYYTHDKTYSVFPHYCFPGAPVFDGWYADVALTTPAAYTIPATATTYYGKWQLSPIAEHNFSSTAYYKAGNLEYPTITWDGTTFSSNAKNGIGNNIFDSDMRFGIIGDDCVTLTHGNLADNNAYTSAFRFYSEYNPIGGGGTALSSKSEVVSGKTYMAKVRYKATKTPVDMRLCMAFGEYNWKDVTAYPTSGDISDVEIIRAGRADTEWQTATFVLTAAAANGIHFVYDDVNNDKGTAVAELQIDKIEIYFVGASDTVTVTYNDGETALGTRTFVAGQEMSTHPFDGANKPSYDLTGWVDENGAPMPSICPDTDATYYVAWSLMQKPLYMKHDFGVTATYGDATGYTEVTYPRPTGDADDGNRNNNSSRANVDKTEGYMRLYRGKGDGAGYLSSAFRILADSADNYRADLTTTTNKTTAGLDYYVKIGYKSVQAPVALRLWVELSSGWKFGSGGMSLTDHTSYQTSGQLVIPAGTVDTAWQEAAFMVHANTAEAINLFFDEADGSNCTSPKEVWIDYVEVYVVVPDNKVDVTYMNGAQPVGTNTGLFKGMALPVSVSVPTVSKKGYSFAGWYDAPTGGNIADTTVAPEEPTIYYARWTDNVTKVLETGFQDGENGLKIFNKSGQVTVDGQIASYAKSDDPSHRGGKGSNNRYCVPAAEDGETNNIAMKMNLEPVSSDETQVVSAFRIYADSADHIYDPDSDKLTQNGAKAVKNSYYQISFRVKAVNLTQSVRVGAVIAHKDWSRQAKISDLVGQSFVHTIGAATNGGWQQVTGVLKANDADEFSIFVLPGKDGIKGDDNTILVDDIEISYVKFASDVTTITLKDSDDTATRQFVANHPMILPGASVRMANDFLNWCTDETYSTPAPTDVPEANTTYYANLSLKTGEWSLVHFAADTSGTCTNQMYVKKGDPIPFPTVTYSDFGWKYDANEWYTDAAFTNAAPTTAPGGEVTYYNKRVPLLQDFETDFTVAGVGSVRDYGRVEGQPHTGSYSLKMKMNQDYRKDSTYARWVVNYNGGVITNVAGRGYRISFWIYSTVTDTFYPRVGSCANTGAAHQGDSVDILSGGSVELTAGQWTQVVLVTAQPTAGNYLTLGGGFSDKYDGGTYNALSADDQAIERLYNIQHKELAFVYIDDVQIEFIPYFAPIEGATNFEGENFTVGKNLSLSKDTNSISVVTDEMNRATGGRKSVKMQNNNPGGDERSYILLTDNSGNPYQVEQNRTYDISFWVYLPSGSENNIEGLIYNINTADLTTKFKGKNTDYRHNDAARNLMQSDAMPSFVKDQWVQINVGYTPSNAMAEGHNYLRLGMCTSRGAGPTDGLFQFLAYVDDITVKVRPIHEAIEHLWDIENEALNAEIDLNTSVNNKAIISRDYNRTPGGGQSLKIISSDSSGAPRTQFTMRDSDSSRVKSENGVTYLISFWAYTPTDLPDDAKFRYWIANGDDTNPFANGTYPHNRVGADLLETDSANMADSLTAGEWKQFYCAFTPTHALDTDYVRLGCCVYAKKSGTYTVYLDDFTLVRTDNGMGENNSFGLYLGDRSSSIAAAYTAGSAIYTASNGKKYCAIRPMASYKTASAACDTVILGGETMTVKERGILFREGDAELIDKSHKRLSCLANGNFDSCWDYDEDTGTCTYSLLINNISETNAAATWKTRSYMVVTFHGTDYTVYSATHEPFTIDEIHDAAEAQTHTTIGWFSD